MTKTRFPGLTLAAFVITAVPSLLQLAHPALEKAFRRDLSAIAAGEWWRLLTSLVFQDGGVFGTVYNLATLAVLGFLAERLLGRARWLLLYAAGAAGGQAAGCLFGHAGAGNSIAVCGLAGGLMIAALSGEPTARGTTASGKGLLAAVPDGGLAGAAGAYYALASVGTGVLGYSIAGVIATAVISALGVQMVARRERFPRWAFPAIGAVAGLVLVAFADHHGVALVCGLVTAAVLSRVPQKATLAGTGGVERATR
ncbi:rhomboid family intramembrane serine protease [Sphaerisporangium perillae]|uniref:rhomboid family intramembrane serine protease n=1 Tax=Sphaerisporangium perillae TaxID=2935860 RepID=UPI00200DFE21|nr:rhomboid family intramembrane serine protease [Sphaerisporangium perillae]